MLCYLLTKTKVFNYNKITMITLFYPLFDAQFVKNRKRLALVNAIL